MPASNLTKEERLAKLVADMHARQAEKEKKRTAKERKNRSKHMRIVAKARAAKRKRLAIDPPPFRLPPPPPGMDIVLPDPEKEPEIPVRWNPNRPDVQFYRPSDKLEPFMEKIARKPGFIQAMEENVKDPRVAKFLKKCGELQNKSLTYIAKSCGLNNTDLARIWRDDKLANAFLEIVDRMPENAKKVMDDSLGDRKTCPRCDGLKRIEIPEKHRDFFDGQEFATCPECDGKGHKITIGSAADKQLIWEKVGWTKQKGGIQVNVNMADHSVDSVIDEMDDLQVVEQQPDV